MGHARLSTRSYSIHPNHCESRSESHLPRELTANEPRHSALALERRSVLIPCLIALCARCAPTYLSSPRAMRLRGEALWKGSSRSRSTRRVQMGRSPSTTRRRYRYRQRRASRRQVRSCWLMHQRQACKALLLGEDPSLRICKC